MGFRFGGGRVADRPGGQRLLRHVRELVQQQSPAGRRVRRRRQLGMNEDAAVYGTGRRPERFGDAPCRSTRFDPDMREREAEGAFGALAQRRRQLRRDIGPTRGRRATVIACHENPRQFPMDSSRLYGRAAEIFKDGSPGRDRRARPQCLSTAAVWVSWAYRLAIRRAASPICESWH